MLHLVRCIVNSVQEYFKLQQNAQKYNQMIVVYSKYTIIIVKMVSI
jgi:hypothetical protein